MRRISIMFASEPPASSTVSGGSAAWASAATYAASTAVAIRIALFIAESSRPWNPLALLWEQHDLADVAALGDEFVGLAGALEGERLGDHGLETTGLEVGHQRLGHAVEVSLAIPPAQHVEAEHPFVLVHHREALPPGHRRQRHLQEAPERGRDVTAAGGRALRQPVHDQAPAGAQQSVV